MSNIVAIENSVKALTYRNPFTTDKTELIVSEGLNILQIVEKIGLPSHLDAIVSIKGDIVKRENWETVYPKKDDFLIVRGVPSGGGGKSPLRMILTVLVLVVAYIAAPALGGYLTAAGVPAAAAQGLAFGLVSTVGMLGVNAIAPPPTASLSAGQDYKSSPSYSISSARNSLTPYGPIPSVLGRVRIVPPYAAIPYTESIGNSQLLYSSFLIGKGPVQIEEHKIGETSLAEFNGAENDLEIDVCDGTETYTSDIIPYDVFPESLTVAVDQASGWISRATKPNTRRIGIDLSCLRGLCVVADNGDKILRSVQIEIQYAIKDSENWVGPTSTGTILNQRTWSIDEERDLSGVLIGGTWSANGVTVVLDKQSGSIRFIKSDVTNNGVVTPNIPSWSYGIATFAVPWFGLDFIDIRTNEVKAMGFLPISLTVEDTYNFIMTIGSGTLNIQSGTIISGSTSEAVFRSFTFPVAINQYDVRIRRITADSTNDRTIDEITWTGLRSYQNSAPVTEPHIARVDLKLKATEKISGAIEHYNCIATTVCLDYDHTTDTWILRPTNNPASLYRYVLQGEANKRALADASVDLATLEIWHDRCRIKGWTFNHYVDYRTNVDSILKMIASAGRASPGYVNGKYSVVMDRVQTNYAQWFNPRNTWDYNYSKIFLKLPHAFRTRFLNEDKGFIEDERIVYDDGYSEANATSFEELELVGITKPTLSWSHARFHIANARLRPETHSFCTDAEHLTCTRGDMVGFSHDVIKVGLGYARIKAYTDDTVNVLTIEIDEEIYMVAGRSYGLAIRDMDGTATILNLVTQEGYQRVLTLSSTLTIANAPELESLLFYGEVNEIFIDLIVTNIKPLANLAARITGVAAAPEVHNADIGPIPSFDSHITEPFNPVTATPGIPAIVNAESSLRVLELSNPTERYGLIVTLIPPNYTGVAIRRYILRYRVSGGSNEWKIVSIETPSVTTLLEDVYVNTVYEIQARSESFYGRMSNWSDIKVVTVTRDTTPPQNIVNFKVNILGADAHLSWDALTNTYGVSNLRIRFSPELSGAIWSASVDLVYKLPKESTSITVPAMVGTYMIKAVDYAGNESLIEAVAITSIVRVLGLNVVETLRQTYPSFTGIGTNTEISTTLGGIIISNLESSEIGYYEFAGYLDLEAIFTARLTASLYVSAQDLASNLYDVADLYSLPNLYGSVEGKYTVSLEVALTNDDPAGTPTWSAWLPFIVGDYTFRAIKTRARLTGKSTSITPILKKYEVTVDMIDRTDGGYATISIGGSQVLYQAPFYAIPYVAFTVVNSQQGDVFSIYGETESGFYLSFTNGGIGVSRQIEYIVKGYGRREI